jgi:hypothetical protein
MNKVEVGQLLAIASGFDRFVTVDRVTTEAWFLALKDVPYPLAQQAAVAHYTGPHGTKPLTVRDVLAAVEVDTRMTDDAIEADVRSAKARGLIGRDWPKREPLPGDVAARLSLARQRDVEEARTYAPAELETN